MIAIHTSEEHAGTTLVLGEGLRVQGRVVTSSGDPVPSAMGVFFAVPLDAEEVAPVLLFETDREGRFDETYDRVNARFASVTVVAEDLPVTVHQVSITDGKQLEIQVSERWSEVRLLVPETQTAPANLERFMLVAQDGGRVTLGVLTGFSAASIERRHGLVEVHIPRLVPGVWRIAQFSTLAIQLRSLGTDIEELPTVAEFRLKPEESRSVEVSSSGGG